MCFSRNEAFHYDIFKMLEHLQSKSLENHAKCLEMKIKIQIDNHNVFQYEIFKMLEHLQSKGLESKKTFKKIIKTN